MSAHTASFLDHSIEHWTAMLNDTDPLRRRLAAYALGEIGPAASGASTVLAAALQDSESFVRVWAAAALLRVDPTHATAGAALVAGMKDRLNFVRSLAAWHIGRLGASTPSLQAAHPGLKQLATDPDASVRSEAALAINRLHARGLTMPS